MRRFSQRTHLVTLSEINITPLLDLAFVLLIIFVITTPLLEQGLNLKLPAGGRPDAQIRPQDITVVEISAQGVYMLDRKAMKLDAIESQLVRMHNANPNLVVNIRTDENAPSKYMLTLLDRCEQHGITRISPRFEPPNQR